MWLRHCSQSPILTSALTIDGSPPTQTDSLPIAPMTSTTIVHPMVTRLRDGTHKPKIPCTGFTSRHPLPTCLQTILHDLNDEPKCYTEASKAPH